MSGDLRRCVDFLAAATQAASGQSNGLLDMGRLRENPHARPGTPLHARFVAARSRCSDGRVALVFHGAAGPSLRRPPCRRPSCAVSRHGPAQGYSAPRMSVRPSAPAAPTPQGRSWPTWRLS